MLDEVESFLKERIGLDMASIGSTAVMRAIRDRCTRCGLPDVQSYWRHLVASEREQQELIEAVVVPETWFFRDPAALVALGSMARRKAPAPTAEKPLRILSVPCSTGEEPLSIGMTLLDVGFSADRFQIDAMDVSARALAYAQLGVYGKNSFRGADLGFRDHYFETTDSGFRISDRVRTSIRFRQSNLFELAELSGTLSYNAIFCRNVLIYFDTSAQQRALGLLHSLLAPDGMLFVGPAEAALLGEDRFISARIPLAFAFHRTDPAAARPKPTRPARVALPPKSLPSGSTPNPRTAPRLSAYGVMAQRESVLPTGAPSTVQTDSLQRARALADEGKLAEAMSCCMEHLRAHPQSVEAFHLAGLLHEASGQVQQARECYRRALYLDPSHYPTLVHLAETLKAAGDDSGAERLLERARRVELRHPIP